MEKQSYHPPPPQSSQQQQTKHHRVSQSHNQQNIQATSQSAKQQPSSLGVTNFSHGSYSAKQHMHQLQNSASQSHNASTPIHASTHYHHKKKHKKQKGGTTSSGGGATGPGSNSHSISEHHNNQKTPQIQTTSTYHPQMLQASNQMANQSHTYNMVNAQSYLDEVSRPLNKSHEHAHNKIKQAADSNNSNRAITQAQMLLFGQLPQEQSFLKNHNHHTEIADKQILAVGAAPNGNSLGKNVMISQKQSSKHKKSAKKVANALGSLSQASTAAVAGMANGNLNQHQSPLLNSHYGVHGSNAGQLKEQIHQYSGVFAQNNQHQDNNSLNSKTLNYYTVINQTLASQVASSMNDPTFVSSEQNMQQQTTQHQQASSQYHHHRRDILSGSAGHGANSANAQSSTVNNYVQSGKRKNNKTASHSGAQQHQQSSLAKSLKEKATSSSAHHNEGYSQQHQHTYPVNHERNAQTSIDWKNAKKKGLGLNIHNNSHQRDHERGKEKTEFAIFQEPIFQPPKTQSGRPAAKKLAAQSIVERIQKSNAAQGVQLHSVNQNNGATINGGSGIKKSGKQSIGLSGRNRTATALLVGSASASSEPLQESMHDGKSSVLQKNSNVSHSRKDQYQLLSQDQQESAGKHLLISQNVIDRKKRLKTSQGTKSGNGVSSSGGQGKLPLMHTLDHQNQISFLKNSKERTGHSNSMVPSKQQQNIVRNTKSKGPIENIRTSAIDSFSISDDGKQSANMTFKKPMGFVKKTRTQVTSNAVSQAVGISGTGFGANTAVTSSPNGKKQKKQKSVSSAVMPSSLQSQKQTSEAINLSHSELSPHSTKEPVFLPHTGIDYPFLKKRPQFIKEAPDFELIHSGNSNLRFVSTASNSIQHALGTRPSEFNARVIYDCTFGGGPNAGPILSSSHYMHTSGNGTALQNGQMVNARYFDRLNQYYNLKGPNDTTLLFESRFESGNLHRATQTGEFEYDLDLKFDHGSPSQQSQWFYFRLSNTRKNQVYKFNIINLIKPDSLYNHGMKPLIYSQKEAEARNIGWHRTGHEIKYFPSKKRSMSSPTSFYTLSWTVEFAHDHDQVYFAHCYPYTYTDCIMHLKRACLPSFSKDRLRRTALCKTKAGNSVEMLIITNFLATQDQIADRKCVILSARVHPGESNSSFVMEGIIDMMLSDDRDARILRDTFVFKIVPMLNPDGVIVGNYRCSLAGLDLNRQWLNPMQKSSPEIVSMKEMVRKTLECRDIHLFVDIHGHSRAKNLFMYGCQQTGANGKALHIHDKKGLLAHKEKVLPVLNARQMDYFSFEGSSFSVQKCKEATGRVVMHREFGIINSYTLEISFCGATQGVHKDTHFSQRMLKEMGKGFCKALVKFSDPPTYRDALREVEDRINGNQNPISKSNYSMQLDHNEKGLHGGAQSTAGATQMILVAGSLSQKARGAADSKNHSTTGGWSNGVANVLESRHSQVK